MTKEFCDKCGREIPAAEHMGGGHFSVPKTSVVFRGFSGEHHFALCNTCQAPVLRFIRGGRA